MVYSWHFIYIYYVLSNKINVHFVVMCLPLWCVDEKLIYLLRLLLLDMYHHECSNKNKVLDYACFSNSNFRSVVATMERNIEQVIGQILCSLSSFRQIQFYSEFYNYQSMS